MHLKEHVAKLIQELGVVARVGGVGQLVGLLDRVGNDRALVLLAVPRAVAAKASRDLVEARQGGRAGGRRVCVARLILRYGEAGPCGAGSLG